MSLGKLNILKALFDIKPVDGTGRVDVDKIYRVEPVVDLALINQKPAEKAGFGLKPAQGVDSGIGSNLSIANKETPEKGASFRSFVTRSIISKTALTPGLPQLYSRTSDLSTTDVDKSEAPVGPTGLAPVTPGVNSGYLLHNTTGPFPGLEESYQKKPTKQNPLAELEKYLNSNLNIRRELRNMGGKTVAKRSIGKPRYRPIFVKQKSGMTNDQLPITNQIQSPNDQTLKSDDYQTILSQINQKPAPALEVEFVGEPRRIEPFENWDVPVKPSAEIESWARYATSNARNFQFSIFNFQSIFKFRIPKALLRTYEFFTNIRIRTFVAVRKFVVIVGVVGFSALVFTSFGQYGISVKNEVVKESNLAVANLEQANENLKVFDFEAASNDFAEAYEKFSRAGDSLNFMGASITSLLAGSLDKLGTSKLKSAKNLVEAGKLLAEAGKSMSEAVNSLSKTGAIFKLSTLTTPEVGHVDNFGGLRKSLVASSKNLSKASALLADVSADVLPEDKQEKFKNLKFKDLPKFEEMVSDGIEYTSFLENLLGSNGIKKYLVLFQNNSELRPTGGFPGTYAVVTFKDGRLADFLVDDVYNLDGQMKENIIPPKPLQHITPNWGMRDANWFIDFSVSAQKIMEFFKKEAGYEVDGVITMSPRIISDILKVVGPIEMPEYGYAINHENFLSTIQAEVEYGDNREQPKQVVKDMAPRLLERIYSAEPGQWLDIFNVFVSGLDKKDILMYFKDLNLESFAAGKGFGGLIKDTDEMDYLMVTFTNIKGSKTDRVTDNSIALNSQFTIHNSQQVIKHKLTITRQHNGGSSKYGFYNRQNPAYVRVLVPEGSELLNISGNSDPGFKPLISYSNTDFKQDNDLFKFESGFYLDNEKEVSIYKESGKTGFAFWLITDPGERKTVELEYAVPFDYAQGKPYDIYIQKQPGLEVDNFEFQVGEAYIYNGKFDKDLEFTLTPNKQLPR